MGFGITELIIVLIIVILLFGTKKLRTIGADLGTALKNFRGAINDNSADPEQIGNDHNNTTSGKTSSDKPASPTDK